MKRVFTVYTPRTRIGIRAAGDVGMLARELDATKSLTLTSPSIVRSGLLDPVKTSLCTNSIAFDIFSECKPDAPIRLVKKCADIAKRGNYELLIGVGGGSVMDTTKAASVLTTAGEDIHSLFGFDRVEKAGIPFILIPTTAGSGSEWSEVSVVTNEVDGLKKVIYSRHIWPNAAIIDPLMSLNTPPKLTAESGMDVLCDCIESFTSWKANIISEMYSEKALLRHENVLKEDVSLGDAALLYRRIETLLKFPHVAGMPGLNNRNAFGILRDDEGNRIILVGLPIVPTRQNKYLIGGSCPANHDLCSTNNDTIILNIHDAKIHIRVNLLMWKQAAITFGVGHCC